MAFTSKNGLIMNTSRYTKHALIWMGLAAVQAASHAGPVDLSDTPLPVMSSVSPNIMIMLDTSGSMENIVPDTPYDPAVTYLTSCPAVNTAAGGVAAPGFPVTAYNIAISNGGAPTIGNKTYGVGSGQRCFDPTLRYSASLSLDVPGTAETVYDGNFLNWYFCTGAVGDCNTAANFGAGARYKPGTRSRMEVTKTAAKAIVDSLDSVRTGLSRYHSAGAGSGGDLKVQMALNTAGQKTTLKNAIDGMNATGYTPLAETLSGIGAYFALVPTGTTAVNLTLHPSNPTTGMLPASMNKSTVSAATAFSGDGAILRNGVSGTPAMTAPIQYACQKSFAVLMTDGRPRRDQTLSSSLCNYLGIAGSCGSPSYGAKSDPNGTGVDVGYHVNGANRQLHLGGTHTYESEGSDFLDDVAGALYDIDLRPDLVKTGSQKNNVSTYLIGFADLETIDDPLMQEAAAAGGGLFFSAANTGELVKAFQDAADDILAKDGSAAAVAVANAHVTNVDNASYATSYNAGVWTGDLIAYPINTNTGVPNIRTPIWNTGCANPNAFVDPTDTTKGVLGCSAQVLLDLQTAATRKIFTSNDTATCTTNCGIPFQPTTADGDEGVAKLSAAQQTLLNTPSTTDGAGVVNYLRGDRRGETSLTYRTRSHLLGDMVNAEPLVIREPDRNYLDNGYTAYKAANDNRARIIFQVSNDGMGHAFDAQTGSELWAYIPNILISNAKDPNSSSTSLLNTRTRKVSFNHYFLMDGTPVSGDIDFANAGVGTPGATADWRTIIVGGMGKGGRGYYALDVTSTGAATEAAAASKALWEFPRSITNAGQRNSAFRDMGFSYGKPVIVKTLAMGWVVLIPSGYNNGTGAGESGGDGKGHLYVVNAKTGDLIADLITENCHATPATNACGLAHINAYIENKDKDNTVELAYGGDLHGNLWRFDLRAARTSDWAVSKMATLRSGAAADSPVQPITTVPELSRVTTAGASRYFVYVGTGLFMGRSDLPCPPSPAYCGWTPNAQSTQTQTMYGLVDTRGTTTLPDPLRSSLVEQTYTTTGNTRTLSANAVNYATKLGWFVNFTGGERLSTDSAIASGALVFTSAIPSTTPCIPGGSSWLYAIDYETGGRVASSTSGGDSNPSGNYLGNALGSRPVLIQLPSGEVKALIRLSDTTTVIKDVPVPPTPASGRRVSWRELIDK